MGPRGVPWPSRGVPWPLYEGHSLELLYYIYFRGWASVDSFRRFDIATNDNNDIRLRGLH